MSFKIGDKVRVKHNARDHCIDDFDNWKGKEVTISEIVMNGRYHIKERYLSNFNWTWFEDQLELVSPSEFYWVGDLVLFGDKVVTITAINPITREFRYNDYRGIPYCALYLDRLKGKLVPLKETDEVKEGEEVWCIKIGDQYSKLYQKYKVIIKEHTGYIFNDIYYFDILDSNHYDGFNSVSKCCFARLVKPEDNKERPGILPDCGISKKANEWCYENEWCYDTEFSNEYKELGRISANNLIEKIRNEMGLNMEESKMDIEYIKKKIENYNIENMDKGRELAFKENADFETLESKNIYIQLIDKSQALQREIKTRQEELNNIRSLQLKFYDMTPMSKAKKSSKKVK